MQRHAVATGGTSPTGPLERQEPVVVGVIAQPPIVGAIGHPQDAIGIDLWITQTLTIARSGAGRRIEFNEFEGLAVEAPSLPARSETHALPFGSIATSCGSACVLTRSYVTAR